MRRLLVVAVVLAGCAQLPPSPQNIQAKKFESVPDKAVIYLARDIPDFDDRPATLTLDGAATITTYPGTYFRWEVAPGVHRIAGFAGDAGVITLNTEPGKVYFVQQRLSPWMRWPQSYFYPVREDYGRAVVMRSQLIP